MTRPPRSAFLSFSLLLIALAACSSAAQSSSPESIIVTGSAPTADGQAESLPTNGPAATPAAAAGPALPRTDSQASVEFVVTPLNLTAPGETLDFDVSLNTHSVDLSWDLAAQSVLSTDTGLEVKGASWPVGGGHHYEGTLSFPAKTADGKPLLDGAKTLTLTIRDAAAPARVFVWALSK